MNIIKDLNCDHGLINNTCGRNNVKSHNITMKIVPQTFSLNESFNKEESQKQT